jgi:hypothetical protein
MQLHTGPARFLAVAHGRFAKTQENRMNVSELMPFRSRRGLSRAQKVALGSAIALVAGPAVRMIASNLRSRFVAWERPAKVKSEAAIDKTLKDTYPASDPPASRYFDIPTNRQ